MFRAIEDMRTTLSPPFPQDTKGLHESLFRSYHIVEQVYRMLSRGDSVETILEFVEWAKEFPDLGTPFMEDADG